MIVVTGVLQTNRVYNIIMDLQKTTLGCRMSATRIQRKKNFGALKIGLPTQMA